MTGPVFSDQQGILVPACSQGFRGDGRGATEFTEDPVLGGCGSWGSKWKDPVAAKFRGARTDLGSPGPAVGADTMGWGERAAAIGLGDRFCK